MINVRNLTKNYGNVKAVKGISFDVEMGHVYGFLGPNGAGKSTTMNMICGCLAPSEGSVTIDGCDILEDAVEAKSHIGYLPEIPALYMDMTPYEMLEFVGAAKKLSGDELYDEIDYVMEKTKITDVEDRLIKNLSKGYRQRVGIAVALMGDPDIIILDEPTVGLDPLQIMEIRDLIRELGEEHTVILSSHILQEISAVCDRVIMISRGTIVADDSLENLLKTADNGTKKLKIETKGTDEDIIAALENYKDAVSVDISGMETKTALLKYKDGAIKSDEVILAFTGAGLPVLSVTEEQTSLEDIFVSLAGESLDAGAAMAAEQAEKKNEKKGKKIIVESERGAAYYEEEYAEVDDEDESEKVTLFSRKKHKKTDEEEENN